MSDLMSQHDIDAMLAGMGMGLDLKSPPETKTTSSKREIWSDDKVYLSDDDLSQLLQS